MNCPQCDIEMEVIGTSNYKGLTWKDYVCTFCDYCYSDEPDWDSLSREEMMIIKKSK